MIMTLFGAVSKKTSRGAGAEEDGLLLTFCGSACTLSPALSAERRLGVGPTLNAATKSANDFSSARLVAAT